MDTLLGRSRHTASDPCRHILSCTLSNVTLTLAIIISRFFCYSTTVAALAMAAQSYNNAVLDITKSTTPDPYVVYAHDKFYLVRELL